MSLSSNLFVTPGDHHSRRALITPEVDEPRWLKPLGDLRNDKA